MFFYVFYSQIHVFYIYDLYVNVDIHSICLITLRAS